MAAMQRKKNEQKNGTFLVAADVSNIGKKTTSAGEGGSGPEMTGEQACQRAKALMALNTKLVSLVSVCSMVIG